MRRELSQRGVAVELKEGEAEDDAADWGGESRRSDDARVRLS